MRVLISPLDWGLGHATRCIPIIKALLQTGCTVFVACEDTAKQLLATEFSDVTFLWLPGYCIRYASSKRWFAAKILQQIPKILRAIWREHRWLKKAVEAYEIDMVIADNRYGLFHAKVPCIFVTHQLAIQTPFAWLSRWVEWLSYRFINRFTECWVPDFEGAGNLAGALSHPWRLPRVPVRYIGPLARFPKGKNNAMAYQWLLLLSGPEPQRMALETALLQVIPSLPGEVMLVRGLPGSASVLPVPAHCTVFNHLPTDDLAAAIAQSEYIISRPGYTTVMEMMALRKKCLLIATPGQTEQEYLAAHLMEQQWCFAADQAKLSPEVCKAAVAFQYELPQLAETGLRETVEAVVKRVAGQRKKDEQE